MEVVFNIPVAYRISGSEATIPIIDMNNITMQATYDSQLVGIDFYQNTTQLLMNTISTMSSFSSSVTKTIIENSNGMHYDGINMGHVNEISYKDSDHSMGGNFYGYFFSS